MEDKADEMDGQGQDNCSGAIASKDDAVSAILQEIAISQPGEQLSLSDIELVSSVVRQSVQKLYSDYEATGSVPTTLLLADAVRCGSGSLNPEQRVAIAQACENIKSNPFAIDTPRKGKRNKVIAIAAAACVVTLLGVGAAYALGSSWQSTPEPVAESQSAHPSKQVSAEKTKKSRVFLTIEAKGSGLDSTDATVSIVGTDGKPIEETVSPNERMEIGAFEAGEYELLITVAPVSPDGSSYKLPEEATKFTVKGDGENVTVKVTLDPVPVEEMSKEQLESAAAALEAAGNSEAATATQNAAQLADPTSSAPSDSGVQGSGSAGGSDISSSGGSQSTTSVQQHVHSYTTPVTETIHHDAVYTTVHHDAVVQSLPIYGSKCATCGAISPSGEHSMQHALNGESDRVINGAVIGYDDQVVSAAWDESVVVSAAWDETVTTGYKCSCGAMQ